MVSSSRSVAQNEHFRSYLLYSAHAFAEQTHTLNHKVTYHRCDYTLCSKTMTHSTSFVFNIVGIKVARNFKNMAYIHLIVFIMINKPASRLDICLWLHDCNVYA